MVFVRKLVLSIGFRRKCPCFSLLDVKGSFQFLFHYGYEDVIYIYNVYPAR